MTIFRAYDVRGKYPEQVNAKLAMRIGKAFGDYMGGGKIAVGCDSRISSPELKDSVMAGLAEMGAETLDIGVVPTPLLYFAVAYRNLGGGVMITASHNPRGYNGFKFCKKGGISLSYDTGIGEIEKLCKKEIKGGQDGKIKHLSVDDEYADYVFKKIDIKGKMKVVIDAGNGSAGIITPKIFRRLGFDVIELYCNPDGNFPNHHPDPLIKGNLADLQKRVMEEKADLGIAFDGDGDRVAFVDEKGNIIDNNSAFSLMIREILKERPGSKILYEILCSKLVEDTIRKFGGVPVVSRVGHSFIQAAMIEKKCELGGETSGHYYFSDNYSFDDGIYAAVKLTEFLSRSERDASEHISDLPEYLTSDETRVECPDEKKFRVIDFLKDKFESEGLDLTTIDGVKVNFREKDSWFVARVSNTQPAIVIRWEAKDGEEYEKVGNLAKGELEKAIKTVN